MTSVPVLIAEASRDVFTHMQLACDDNGSHLSPHDGEIGVHHAGCARIYARRLGIEWMGGGMGGQAASCLLIYYT